MLLSSPRAQQGSSPPSHVCNPAWTSLEGHNTRIKRDVTAQHICQQPLPPQVAGQGRRVAGTQPPRGTGPAAVMEQLVALPCAHATVWWRAEGWWQEQDFSFCS